MSTPKGKPKGYFRHILAIDCESTGLCFSCDDPTHDDNEHHQAVSWGVIVADSLTLEPVEDLYLEVKWNADSVRQRSQDSYFGRKAESIHGLTKEYLDKNGILEVEAVEQIGNLIMKYWGPNVSIRTLGHNVHMFDLPFLRDMFRRHGIELKFGNRHYDTNSIGFTCFTTFTSDELFNIMGFSDRGKHNSLEDAHMALTSARNVRKIMDGILG